MRNNTPILLSNRCLRASADITMAEANNAYKPVVSAILPDTVIGEIGETRGPIPMDRLASTRQLPIASPMAISYCLLRMAVRSTASSGREVPMATRKKLITYSSI